MFDMLLICHMLLPAAAGGTGQFAVSKCHWRMAFSCFGGNSDCATFSAKSLLNYWLMYIATFLERLEVDHTSLSVGHFT